MAQDDRKNDQSRHSAQRGANAGRRDDPNNGNQGSGRDFNDEVDEQGRGADPGSGRQNAASTRSNSTQGGQDGKGPYTRGGQSDSGNDDSGGHNRGTTRSNQGDEGGGHPEHGSNRGGTTRGN